MLGVIGAGGETALGMDVSPEWYLGRGDYLPDHSVAATQILRATPKSVYTSIVNKRALPEGQTCCKIMISALPGDVRRWDRIAAEQLQRGHRAYATRSGAIRLDAIAARRLRHDARNPLGAITLTSEDLRRRLVARGGLDSDLCELLDSVDRAADELARLLAEAGDPPHA